MRSPILRAGIGALMLALATTAVAAPASAAPGRLSLSAAGAQPYVQSSYLAGWQKNNVHSITSASVKFVLPSLFCAYPGPSGAEFGLGNEPTEGAPTMLAAAAAFCSGSIAAYAVEVLTPDGATQFGDADARAGDAMTATITQSGGQTTADVYDATTQEDVTVTGASGSDTTVTYGAFPLDDGPTQIAPPFFSNVVMQPVSLNGAPLDTFHPRRLTLITSNVVITTGDFGPHDGFRLVCRPLIFG